MRRNHTIDPYYFSPEWIELRTIVVQMNQHICAYCGSQGFQADHVIPRSKGGPDSVSNLVCCCARCNKLVGGLRFDSFDEKKKWIKAKLKSADRPPASICTVDGCQSKKVKGFAFCAKHLGQTRATLNIKGGHPNRKRARQRN